MIRKALAFIICVALMFLPTGCREKKIWRIGVSQCSSDDWRSKMNDEINREIMLHEDATVEIRSANDDNARQIEDIRYFVDNGFDIILVAPNEAEALTPVIKEVWESGVPVVVFDRDIVGDTYTARIGVDNCDMGRSAGAYARNLLNGAEVKAIEIRGRDGSTPAAERHRGFVEELVSAPGMTLVASAVGNWNENDAKAPVDSMLKEHPEANLIYAHNDRMAIGAAAVARDRGRDDIRIIGIDAAPNIGIKAVADSIIDATFLYPTEGHRLVRTALAILNGEPFEKEEKLPLTSAVDLSNANILLLQNEALAEETRKMSMLKSQVDLYWERHSAQTVLFYAAVAIVLLLCGVVFLLLRAFWQHKRYRQRLLEQNSLLEAERDKQQQLNRQLEEATQSKLMFFTNVSHDLRTPLTLIAEPVEQLAGATNLTPQQQSLMTIASRNVKILKRLINEILDFRKYENGKMELALVEADFGKLVKEWGSSFAELARKRRIRFNINVDESVGNELIDVEKIERVFFNLVSNAFKHTPDNGAITVSVTATGDRLKLSVADNGEGIAPDEIKHIFDRFYQVDKVHPKGSGIGLSLAKAFVELHGGSISVDSTKGSGAVFTVEIPRRTPDNLQSAGDVHEDCMAPECEGMVAELESSENMPHELRPDKPVVLVIDDNPDIRALLSEMLSGEYNVITAPDGRERVKSAARYVPDLIICDVMMPEMDGVKCCSILKRELVTSHIPVLMLTACGLDEQRARGFDSGADGYMSKPFNMEVLKSWSRSLIANRKRIKEVLGAPGVKAQGAVAGADSEKSKAPSVKAPGDIDSEFYARFVEIVNSQLGNSEMGVDDLAAKMGLGRSQFYRKIKALTNFSPVELIRDMRLQRARTLLTTTEKSVSEIGYETGFSTPAYFTKCFRDAFGETPTEFRAKLGIG